MHEARKTKKIRSDDFELKYLQGRVLDVGAGPDKLCDWAESFDKIHGDANNIGQYFAPESFDTIHSSHCLEHLHDPQATLRQFYQLLKPNGYIISVVPDEDTYECGYFPSLFNPEHQWTFRNHHNPSWSPKSLNIRECHENLPNGAVISCQYQCDGFDLKLVVRGIEHARAKNQVKWLHNFYNDAMRTMGYNPIFIDCINRNLWRLGLITDQTMGSALAQIEVIYQKYP